MGKIDWRVVGLEQGLNQIRNLALGMLFVEIAQTRAMRSAGTLGAAILTLESALIRAHYAALQWGFTTNEALVQSQGFQNVSAAVEQVGLEYGKLKMRALEAQAAGGFAFTAGLK